LHTGQTSWRLRAIRLVNIYTSLYNLSEIQFTTFLSLIFLYIHKMLYNTKYLYTFWLLLENSYITVNIIFIIAFVPILHRTFLSLKDDSRDSFVNGNNGPTL